MAQPDPDTHERSHTVVIDVADDGAAAAGEPPRCCCVCTEPLEWVAVGRCGHRDVCAACATRIRFFGGDRRCCICRTRCHTVHVTRAGGGGGDGASRQPGFYYHTDTGAHFDDRRQYTKAVEMCVKPPCTEPAANQGAAAVGNLSAPSSQPAGVVVNHAGSRPPRVEEAGCPRVGFVGIYLGAIMISATMFGLFFKVYEVHYQRVGIVVAFGLLSVAVTVFAISSWQEFKRHLNSQA